MSQHEEDDPQLDTLLTEHLSVKLSGQVGRAAMAFQREADAKLHAEELRRTRRAWIWASIPAAVAACIVMVATLGYWRGPVGPLAGNVPSPGGTGGGTVAHRVDENTYYRDFDAGIRVVRDQTGAHPMREIRRQVVRETEWYDPAEKAHMRITVPEEGTVYVKVQPF